jgi:hypothetical protein
MFNISANGTREGISKHVQAAKLQDGLSEEQKPAAQAQLDAAKVFIATEIAALPKQFNGARVVADGTAHDGGRTFTLTIIPQVLHV